MIRDKWVVEPHGVDPPTFRVCAELESNEPIDVDPLVPTCYLPTMVVLAKDLDREVAIQIVEDHEYRRRGDVARSTNK